MSWFTVRAQTPGIADVTITGTIAAGAAREFTATLPRSARIIRLTISSLGGDPGEALVIAQALRAHPARVEVTIQKIAASAATLPACAGNRVVIDASACAMLHNPHAVLDDTPPLDAPTLRAVADQLDRVKAQMLDVYGWRLKGGREAIAALMTATTWLDPAEAVARGLADEVRADVPSTVTAQVDLAALAALGPIPPRFAARIAELRTGSRHSLAPPPLRDPRDSWKASHERLDRRTPAFNVLEVYQRLNTPTQGGRP